MSLTTSGLNISHNIKADIVSIIASDRSLALGSSFFLILAFQFFLFGPYSSSCSEKKRDRDEAKKEGKRRRAGSKFLSCLQANPNRYVI